METSVASPSSRAQTRWRSAPLPGDAQASWGGSYWAIPARAQHKALAWDFIRALCLDRTQQLEAFRRLDCLTFGIRLVRSIWRSLQVDGINVTYSRGSR